MRGEEGAGVGELWKLGIGGFPRGQKIRVLLCGGCDGASLLAGQRDAVKREARTWPIDECAFGNGLGIRPDRI